jgi:MEMO1 family protein
MARQIKKIVFMYLFVLLFFGLGMCSEDIQFSCLDGSFYPKQRSVLREMVSGFIAEADPGKIDGEIIAIISPHAGYIYSGDVAGFGFKAIQDRGFDKAVIIAPSHRHYFEGLSVLDKDAYSTPLGKVYIDQDITRRLLSYSDKINYQPQFFLDENSVETQIPFIQQAMPEAEIAVVLIGDRSYDTCLLLSDALYDIIAGRDDILIIASTDMSHFSNETRARATDRAVMDEIMRFNPEDLFLYMLEMENKDTPCGWPAIVSTMMTAKKLGADGIDILRYSTSADVTGDASSVVGYMSAAIIKSRKGKVKDSQYQKQSEADMDSILNEVQRKRLLEIARSNIEAHLQQGRSRHFNESDSTLNKELGAFVTLHKNGQLRGCIGNIIGRGPLYKTVSEMAVQAAFNDPRFDSVKQKELDDIEIEISVLSPLERIYDPDKIIIGTHGVLVKSGLRSGVYLPQVGTETGWSRDEFMNSLCMHKAGLDKDSWRTGSCEIYIFCAEVFKEKR